jgi:ABC-type nitrate/sulfonate/bicarbonate transport system substrate-binding protein
MVMKRFTAVALLAAALFGGTGAHAEEITLLTTVLRAVNLPMLVGLRLLEKEDGIKVAVKDVRTPESVMLATIDGQGQVGTGFAPFYPAVEKGAPVKGLMELSRVEFVVMAKKEVPNAQALNGLRLASHSPKSTVQSLLEYYFASHPGIKPTIVFIPEGSPARASALMRGAVDAAAFDLSSAKTVSDSVPGKFHILVDFTNEPLSSNVLVFNPAYAKAHPDVVRKVIARMLESYRRGVADPGYWVRERGEWLKDIDAAKLEPQMRDVAKIVDVNGGIERLRGKAAMKNIEFQVTAGNLSGPASKWKPEQFFDTGPLEAVLKEVGRK